MIRAFLALAFLAFGSQSALASGGFGCQMTSHAGNRYEISGCMSHGIMGLCPGPDERGATVYKNGQELQVIPIRNKTGFWYDGDMFLVNFMDEEFNRDVLRITYFGPGSKKNRAFIEGVGSFRDVFCDFE
jgi:hypothetical protein